MKLFRGRQGADALPNVRLDSRPAEVDGGPVIVLVDERGGEQDALDWAAAEAVMSCEWCLSFVPLLFAGLFGRLLN